MSIDEDEPSDLDSDDGDDLSTTGLIATRAKRSTAGNLYATLRQNLDDEELQKELLAEDDEDVGEYDGSAVDVYDDDEALESSSEDDAGPPQHGEVEDLSGEKELKKQERQAARKRKRAEQLSKRLPAWHNKRPRIGPVDEVKSDGGAPGRPRKKSERSSWLPAYADAPTRQSERASAVQNREIVHANLAQSAARSEKQRASTQKTVEREKRNRRMDLTLEQRLAKAAKIEKETAREFGRWEREEAERQRIREEQLAAKRNRRVEGPTVIHWSGSVLWEGDKIKVKRMPDKQQPAEGVDPDSVPMNVDPPYGGTWPIPATTVIGTEPPFASQAAHTPFPSIHDATTNVPPSDQSAKLSSHQHPPANPAESVALTLMTPSGDTQSQPQHQSGLNGHGLNLTANVAPQPQPLATSFNTIPTNIATETTAPFNHMAPHSTDGPSMAQNAGDNGSAFSLLDGIHAYAAAPPMLPPIPTSHMMPGIPFSRPGPAFYMPSSPYLHRPLPLAPPQVPYFSDPRIAIGQPPYFPYPVPAHPLTFSQPSHPDPSLDWNNPFPWRSTQNFPSPPLLQEQAKRTLLVLSHFPNIKPAPPPSSTRRAPRAPKDAVLTPHPLTSVLFPDAYPRLTPDETRYLTAKPRKRGPDHLLPPAPTKTKCALTSWPAKYRDPSTGLPYADAQSYKMIHRLLAGGCSWSALLGAWVGPVYGPMGRPAKGVPPGFGTVDDSGQSARQAGDDGKADATAKESNAPASLPANAPANAPTKSLSEVKVEDGSSAIDLS